MKLELHATPEEVMRGADALRDFCRARKIDEKTFFALALALEECASNIVNHALQRDAQQTFRMSLEYASNSIIIELRDRGPQFDPTHPAAMKKEAGDAGQYGGWGIELVRRYTDKMLYRREGGDNVLRLMKRINMPAGENFSPHQQRYKETKFKGGNNIMGLKIQIQKSTAGAVTVKLDGSLDTATSPDLERQLSPVLAGPVKDLMFDLANLKFISSAGLRVFAMARKRLKERGGQTGFVNLQPQIREVFEIMKSLPGVAIFKDVAEFDDYIAARQRAHEENR